MALLPKLVACWLVVLVVVPFTAPFATCDVNSLLGESEESPAPGPRGGQTAPHHVAPVRVARRAPRGREQSRPPHGSTDRVTRDDAVPRAPFASNARGVRLLPVSRVPIVATTPSSAATAFRASLASAGGIREQAVLSTILRL